MPMEAQLKRLERLPEIYNLVKQCRLRTPSHQLCHNSQQTIVTNETIMGTNQEVGSVRTQTTARCNQEIQNEQARHQPEN